MRIFFIGIMFFLSACSSIKKPFDASLIFDQDETLKIVSSLKDKTRVPQTFKGIGKIKLWNKDRIEINERAVWAGAIPEKLSVLIRSISGGTLAKLACDGEWFYFLLQGRLYKKRLSDADLDPIVSISVKPTDILLLLAGGIPVQPHNKASLVKDKKAKGYVLILKKTWGIVVQKIYLNENMKHVERFELFNSFGFFKYGVVILKPRLINGYEIPSGFVISNRNIKFKLEVERFWTDVPVSASVFVLSD